MGILLVYLVVIVGLITIFFMLVAIDIGNLQAEVLGHLKLDNFVNNLGDLKLVEENFGRQLESSVNLLE